MSPFSFLRWVLAVLAIACALRPARAQVQPQPLPPADWAVACGSNGGPTILTVDALGNIYVVGFFRGTITIGPATLMATQPPPATAALPTYFWPNSTRRASTNGPSSWAMGRAYSPAR